MVSEAGRNDRVPRDTVKLWEVSTGKLLRSLRPDVDAPAFLVFSPDGERIATSRYWRHAPRQACARHLTQRQAMSGHESFLKAICSHIAAYPPGRGSLLSLPGESRFFERNLRLATPQRHH
jgi:WD40 repeat protein